MAKMVLYDACIHLERLGTIEKCNDDEDNESRADIFSFTLDDIDYCFERVSLVKYSEEKTIKYDRERNLPGVSRINYEGLKISALPSGRTVGGSSWLISYGAATVVYAVGINTKKEWVLDGLDLELFPKSPTLLIVDGDCSTTTNSGSVHRISRRNNKQESSTKNPLVNTVIETIRKGLGGNVINNILIPCESGGRALELMQLLAKHVMNDKSRLEVDRLIYLTPMASNVVDFAKAQLEWMSDSLCKAFYKGETNPFEFSKGRKQMELLKCVTSLEEMDQLGNAGVKIVLATDSSLSAGFSRELLLRWGGNPSSLVIFTSEPEVNSLGSEVMRQINTPPVLATIVRREKVLLQGEELMAYMKAEEEKKKVKAEAELQDKREAELNAFVSDVNDVPDDSEDEISDGETADENGNATKIRKPNNHAVMLEGLGKYAKPRYAQFENYEFDVGKTPLDGEISEYGKSITDLNLPKTIMSVKRSYALTSSNADISNTESGGEQLETQSSDVNISEEARTPPSKLMKVTDKVQLTCAFRYVPLDGRADLKTIRTMISEINPQNAIVLKGKSSGDHLNIVMGYIKDGGHSVCSPFDYETLNFEASGGSRKITLPSGSRYNLKSIKAEIKNSIVNNEGVNLSLLEVHRDVEANNDVESANISNVEQITNTSPLCLSSLSSEIEGSNTLGRLSVGEVSLKSLKSKIRGIHVEYKLGIGTATLLCNQQSTIRKINRNDLVIEGSPGFVFSEAKRGVYSSFSFK